VGARWKKREEKVLARASYSDTILNTNLKRLLKDELKQDPASEHQAFFCSWLRTDNGVIFFLGVCGPGIYHGHPF
jgi:hypothetical protein